MLKNVASNWALSVLQISLLLILTPFVEATLGKAGYGMWETVISAVMPFQLLALGLPMATVRTLSAAIGRQDPAGANRAIGTALTMTLGLGAVAAALAVALYPIVYEEFFAGSEWIHAAPRRSSDLNLALALMLGSVAASFVLRLPYAVFDAHKDFIPRNIVMALGFITRLIGTLALLQWRADLTILAGVHASVLTLEFMLATWVSRRLHPSIRFRITGADLREAKSLLSFSIFAFMLNMGALLAFRIDNLVIKKHLDELHVTDYSFGAKIFDPMITLLLAIGSVIMPVAASAAARSDLTEIRTAFLRWSRIAALIVLVMGSYVVVLGPHFLRAWLDASSTSGQVMQVLMVSFLLFLPVRSVALPVLMGLGQARTAGLALLGMGLTNLVLSLTLIGKYGVMGVALGTAIPNVAFSLFLAAVATRALGVPFLEWARYTFGRPLVAALACGGALAVLAGRVHMEGFARLIPIGMGHTVLFVALTLGWVLRGDPRIDASPIVRRVFPMGQRPSGR